MLLARRAARRAEIARTGTLDFLPETAEVRAGPCRNAGRWDYLFSIIKNVRDADLPPLPDRAAVTMTAPMLTAYSDLLVQTCHKRGARAMGGMAAFIPSRHEEINRVAFAKVREDKMREAGAGFDGSWVAHPDLVHTVRGDLRRRPRRPESGCAATR